MTITKIDHLAELRSYTIEQSKNKPILNKLSEILLSPLQEVEEILQDMQNKRWIEDSEGIQLDLHGQIVGEARDYRDDEDYRKSIYSRIAINHGGGTPEEIVNAVREIYNTDTVLYRDVFPASFLLFFELDKDARGKKALIESMSPAGVSSTLVCHVGSNPFYFSECTTEQIEFMVKKVKALEANLAIDIENDITKTMNVSAEVFTASQTWLGFSEIIVSRRDLTVNYEKDLIKDYLVDKDRLLETTNSLKDFIIIGGCRFAEINDI